MRTYSLFISHSWTYGDQYERLVDLLQERGYFPWRNCSVPKDNRLHTNGTDQELYNAIKNQISPSSVVLILAGVYSSHSKWIDKEIHIAQNEFHTPKPIIAIEPWGSKNTSTIVKEAADIIVRWNTESIVSAIRKLG